MKTLVEGLADLDLPGSPDQLSLWNGYLDLLVKWNKAFNLTAIQDRNNMVVRHLLDSLSIAPHVTCSRLLDIGAGAGLPSIPLAILWPERQIVAMDSNGKKVRFMQQVKHELGLANFTPVQSRVEAWKPGIQFDGITCRAFASLYDMVALSEHLLTDSGCYWAMKGRIDNDELSTLPKPFKVSDCLPLTVPDDHAMRHLVVVKRQT